VTVFFYFLTLDSLLLRLHLVEYESMSIRSNKHLRSPAKRDGVFCHSRVRGSLLFWIPAFAGMTPQAARYWTQERIKRKALSGIKKPQRTTRRRGLGRLTRCRRGDGTSQDIARLPYCQGSEKFSIRMVIKNNRIPDATNHITTQVGDYGILYKINSHNIESITSW
jgi:hypothetical protein